MREPSHANQLGESAYRLNENYFMTERVKWSTLVATLEQFEHEAWRFFRLCVTDQLHQVMMPKAA